MGRRKLEDKNIRKLSKKGFSYLVTLPIESIKDLGWKKSQKLVVKLDKKRKRIIVEDWKA
ncbi:hypothetical protein ACFLY7_00470 [Patescibacteria group bacterium]